MGVGPRQVVKRVPGAVALVRRARWWRQRMRWYHLPGLRHGYPPTDHFYQSPDWWIVNYELYSPPALPRDLYPGLPVMLRGPAPDALAPGGFVACVGAAQTFGRFCEKPFAALLSEDLGLPTVNLGFGGANPQLFVRQPKLLGLMNKSALVVLQVMSARNEDNSLFEGGGFGSLRSRATGEQLRAEEAYELLLASRDRELVTSVVRETRRSWVASYQRLVSSIEVPIVLLWLSVRAPEYNEEYGSVEGLFGDFPPSQPASRPGRIGRVHLEDETSDGVVAGSGDEQSCAEGVRYAKPSPARFGVRIGATPESRAADIGCRRGLRRRRYCGRSRGEPSGRIVPARVDQGAGPRASMWLAWRVSAALCTIDGGRARSTPTHRFPRGARGDEAQASAGGRIGEECSAPCRRRSADVLMDPA
jgi:hypothetical protein